MQAEHSWGVLGVAVSAGLGWGFITPSSKSNSPASSQMPSHRGHTSIGQALVITNVSHESQAGQDTGSLWHVAHTACPRGTR